MLKRYQLICILLLLIGANQLSAQQFLKADSLLGVARDYLSRSMPDNAVPILLSIIENNRENRDVVDCANINLAEAYREKQEYSKGVELIRHILGEKDLSDKNRAFAWNRLAALYNEWGDEKLNGHDSTVKYSLLCIDISVANSFTEYLAASQNELGYVYTRDKEFDKALGFYRNSYLNFFKVGLIPNAMNVGYNISGAYLSMGDPKKALEVVDSALMLSSEDQYKNMYMRLYLRKSDIYEYLRDFANAYWYQKKAREMQEGFFKDRIELQINEMSAKYDLQLKEQKIAEIRHANEIQRQQKIYLSIIVVILLLVLLVILVNFRLKKKIRFQKEEMIRQENLQLKNVLEFKNKELEYKNQELIKATSNIIAFNDVLLNLKTAVEYQQNETAISIIRNNLNFDNTWEKFRLNFEQIHPDFFLKLRNRFSMLSENDQKLCAFLYLGLKTIEISELMCISDVSVSKSRNRLRKKLELERGADIGEFLRSLC